MAPFNRTRPRIPDEVFASRLDSGGRPLFVVSDLHLGLAPGFGFPAAREATLATAIAQQSARGSIIVLNGDIIEDGQGASPLGVLARYPHLLGALGEASVAAGGVYYVAGNHDPAVECLRAELPWHVVRGLVVDETILVTHGDALDVGLHETTAGRASRLHGSVQRCLGTPINLPLQSHNTFRNRLVVGLGACAAEAARTVGFRRWVDENLDYLASLDAGQDPRFIVWALSQAILPPAIQTVIAGHTHRPGQARVGSLRYLNSGAWSQQLATAVLWSNADGEVRDLVSGAIYGFEAYQDWQARTPWTTWWSQARGELSPGRLLAERVRVGLSALRNNAKSQRHRTSPRRDTLELKPAESDKAMNIGFKEIMRGALRPQRHDSRPVSLELCGATRADFVRSCLVDLEGTICIDGFAANKHAMGTLRLSARTWEYDLAFVADDGRPYRLLVHKTLRALDLIKSFTQAHGDIVDARGQSVGRLELRFELDRDLGPLIRSFTTRAAGPGVDASPPAQMPVLADPYAWGPLDGAENRVVAVTGAAGHLGFTIASQLRDRGYRVLGLVRDATDARAAVLTAKGVEVREADVLSVPSLTRALADESVEGLLHTAAPFLLWAKDEEREIVAPLIEGTLSTLQAARGCGVRRVVLTSAGGAVGHDAGGRDALCEDDWNSEPRSPYLRGKTEAERSAWEFAARHDLDLVTVLPTAILGPNFFNHTPVTRLLDDIVQGKVPALPDFAHSWVDVRDVARAHILAFESPAAHGRYIVSATYRSWRAVIDALHAIDRRVSRPPKLPDVAIPLLPIFDSIRARLLGQPRALTRAVVAELHGREPRYCSARAQRELGLRFIDFEQTLTDTLRWLDIRRTANTSPAYAEASA